MCSKGFRDTEPVKLHTDYFGGDDSTDTLVLEAVPDLLPPEEQLQLEAALLHPKARTEHEARQAALVLCTSQLSQRRASKLVEGSRVDRAEKWRKALGSGGVAARLEALVTFTGKSKKTVKKKLKSKSRGRLGLHSARRRRRRQRKTRKRRS